MTTYLKKKLCAKKCIKWSSSYPDPSVMSIPPDQAAKIRQS